MVGGASEKSNRPAEPDGPLAWLRKGGAIALGRGALAEAAIALTEPGGASHPSAPDGGGGGGGARPARGTVRLASLPQGGEVAIRHYRRGGLLGRLLGDRYGPGAPARAAREVLLYDALWRIGVPTLEPVAAVARRAGAAWWAPWSWWWRLDLVTRAVRGAANLGDLYRGGVGAAGLGGAELGAAGLGARPPAIRRALLESAGRAVRALHEAGVEHPDLNARNLLVEDAAQALSRPAPENRPGTPMSAPPRVLVIDLDRARARSGPLPEARRAAALARLLRSVEKLFRAPAGAPPPTRADLARFLRGYGGRDRAERRRVAEAVRRASRWTWLHRLGWRLAGSRWTRS